MQRHLWEWRRVKSKDLDLAMYGCKRISKTLGVCAVLALSAGCGKTSKSHGSHDSVGTDGIGGAAGDAGIANAGSSGSGGSGDSGGSGVGGSGGSGGDAVLPCNDGVVGSSQIPRLTKQQYDRTVRDLLGVTELSAFGDQPPSALLGADHTGDLSDPDWQGYMSAGEAIAVQVMASADLRSHFMACTPTGDGAACLHDTIVAFGRRAFRRPLTDAEIQRFEAFIEERDEITKTGAAEEVAEVILQTFLVSPSFIQRSELSTESDATGHFVLSSHEVASRLSYMLWGSTPDLELDQTADADALRTPEQIRAQAERMIADPKARDLVVAFHRVYLDRGAGSAWESVRKDTSVFPEFGESVVRAMNEETDRFFDAVIFDEAGSFADLFTSPLAFVNRDTAPLYGLDPEGFDTTLEQVALDAVERPGVLTRLGFLATYSSDTQTSPTRRGGFLARQILGLDLSPPPDHTDIGGDREEFETNRAFVEALTAPAECAACHTSMDPFVFVLEAYDSIGRHQTREADTDAPIDTLAEVSVDGASVTVAGPAELMALIGASQDAQRKYVRTWIAHTFGRPPNVLDECVEQSLSQRLTEDDYTVLDLLIDLTQTEAFVLRAPLEEEP